MEPTRINKYISMCGVCSRRNADILIENKKVFVNGKVAVSGMKVTPNDEVVVNNQKISFVSNDVLIAFNKPIGIVCTCYKNEKNNIIDYISYDKRIFPIGRLDKDSSGLILLTNNGEIMEKILRGQNGHEKEYYVELNRPISDSIIKAMEQGVPILNTITRPCKIHRIDEKSFTIILTQGLNRQIRRMCEYFDLRVKKLKRTRIINIELGNLEVGKWRELTEAELLELKNELK